MSEAGDALRRLADRADNEGGRAAAKAMGDEGRKAVQAKLGHRSHAHGTPTPSPPGTPPARISGRLQGSIMAEIPRSIGAGVWVSHVGPHGVVYAAIQQRGGRAGHHHASTLPPRPYLGTGPYPGMSEAAASAFYRAVQG